MWSRSTSLHKLNEHMLCALGLEIGLHAPPKISKLLDSISKFPRSSCFNIIVKMFRTSPKNDEALKRVCSLCSS